MTSRAKELSAVNLAVKNIRARTNASLSLPL